MKKFLAVLAVLMLALAVGCGKGAGKGQITIKGSDTEVNVVTDFAEQYMKANPGVKIAVTGGGSGTGIAALINKQVDIANSSRLIKDKEVEDAKAKGINPVMIVIATDGVSAIVNPANKVGQLTVEQLAAIFKGEINNWKELGGDDIKITCYGRQNNSGTYEFFLENVLKKKDFGASVNQMNGNAQIYEAVKTDKGGIGYVGVAYVTDENGNFKQDVKILALAKAAGGPFFQPDAKHIMEESYPLTRPLNQYTDGIPTGELLKFLQFSISKEAEAIVRKNGFYPVQPKYHEVNKKAGLM